MRGLFFLLCAVFLMQFYACVPAQSQHRNLYSASTQAPHPKPTTPLTVQLRPESGIQFDEPNNFIVELQSTVALDAVEFKLNTTKLSHLCVGQTQWSGDLPARFVQTLHFQCFIAKGTTGYIEVSAVSQYAGSQYAGAGTIGASSRIGVGVKKQKGRAGDNRLVVDGVNHLSEYQAP